MHVGVDTTCCVWQRIPQVNMVHWLCIFEVLHGCKGQQASALAPAAGCAAGGAAAAVVLLGAALLLPHNTPGRPWAQCRSTTVDPVIVGCNNTMMVLPRSLAGGHRLSHLLSFCFFLPHLHVLAMF